MRTARQALLVGQVAITFTQPAKTAGTGSEERYGRYRHATSMRQALDLGATRADLYNDIRKGIIVPTDARVANHLAAHCADQANIQAWAEMAFPFHSIQAGDMDLELVTDAALRAHPSPALMQAINASTGRESFPPWRHAHSTAAAAPEQTEPEPEPMDDDEPDFAPHAALHAIPAHIPGASTFTIPEAWPLIAGVADVPSAHIHYGPIRPPQPFTAPDHDPDNPDSSMMVDARHGETLDGI